jgi:hypothetical protein
VLGRQQRGRQATTQQSLPHVGDAERRQLFVQHRHELDHALAARETVAKLLGGCEGGRADGQNLQLGKPIRPDLQQAARIGKLVDFIKHHEPLFHRPKKAFRIAQTFRHARQVAVQELRVGQALRQHGLADPSRAGQPDDGRLFPGGHQPLLPERTLDYAEAFYF